MRNHSIQLRRTHLQYGVASLLFFLAISCYLLVIGELVALAAWLIVVVTLLPIFLVSRLVKSTLLEMVVGIAFVTQLISVPIFVLNREDYTSTGWSAVKDFSFTVPEFISIYALLALFLVSIVCSVAALVKLIPLPKLPSRHGTESAIRGAAKKGSKGYNLIVLIMLVFVMAPLNMWMFRNGISLVGVEPPRLPFRLSGILHYLTYLVVPAVLATLYARSSRNYTPAIILMAYAFLLGVSQVSKSAVLLITLPILYYAILDRRYVLLSISAIFALISIQIVSLFRGVVYLVENGKASADVAGGLIESLGKLVNDGLSDFSLAETLLMMVNRIEGAQDIVLSYQFNADVVGGVFESFLRFFYDRWTIIDADAFHIELIGVALPEGFVAGGGGLLSKALLITQSQPLYIAIFAIIVAIFIYLGEWIARSISIKYSNHAYYVMSGGLYILFFYVGSGSSVFLGLLALLLLIVVMPRSHFLSKISLPKVM